MTESKAAKSGFYEIMRPLATGGMAELFLARVTGPQGFEKLVALKKILPQLAQDARCVRSLLDEAKLAAYLDHPHIVQVHDLVMLDGDYCLAMEYVRGRDLCALLSRSKCANKSLPIEHAVQIARAVASALHYAHERLDLDNRPLGIVHRDVSPANILISVDGVAKLLDFGVAKAATTTLVTHVGMVKGKPAYMAPEQAAGVATDRRADVYALGVVLAEMVVGERVHDIERSVPASRWRHDCPPELDAIILRALALERDIRYQTARELQLALEELARTRALGQSPVALADYVQGLFADDSGKWSADAAGVTVSERVGACSAEVTVSERGARSADTAERSERPGHLAFRPGQPAHRERPSGRPSVTAPDHVVEPSRVVEPSQVATNVYRTTHKMTATTASRHKTIAAIALGLAVLALGAAVALGGQTRSDKIIAPQHAPLTAPLVKPSIESPHTTRPVQKPAVHRPAQRPAGPRPAGPPVRKPVVRGPSTRSVLSTR